MSEKINNFILEYKKLCEKYGLVLSVNPAFIPRDDGSWSVVLQTSVGKFKGEQKIDNTN